MRCSDSREEVGEVADDNRVMARARQQPSTIPTFIAVTNEDNFRHRFVVTVKEDEAPRSMKRPGGSSMVASTGCQTTELPQMELPAKLLKVLSAACTPGHIAGTSSCYGGHLTMATASSVTMVAPRSPRSKIRDAQGLRCDPGTAAHYGR